MSAPWLIRARKALKARGAPRVTAAVDDAGGLDWAQIEAALPEEAAAMRACVQDALYHAEGDVWTHTRMVHEALTGAGGFADLAPEERRALALAALFHDIEKPATRVVAFDPAEDRERVRHPHHAALGARSAFRLLWLEGAPLALRLRVMHLIAWHQRVFHVINDADLRWRAIQFAGLGRWSGLIRFGRADNLGRAAPNLQETEENFRLLEAILAEWDLLEAAFPFPDDFARAQYLAKPGRSEYTRPPAPSGSRVIVLVSSGGGQNHLCAPASARSGDDFL